MDLKPLNSALAIVFGAGGLAGAAANSWADELSGSLTDAGSVQSSAGPSFDFTASQVLATCLCPGYSGYLVGDLNGGIMSAQAVTGTLGSAPGNGQAMAAYSTTITNTGSTPQAFVFNYYIGSGTLISDPVFNYGSGPGSVTAQISATIALNGQTAWSYGATLTGSAASSASGGTFNLVTSPGGPAYVTTPVQGIYGESVSFSPYTGSFALGTLAAGQSEVLTYTLSGTTTTSGITPSQLAYYGGALAQIGDPFSVQDQGITTFGVTPSSVVSAVPEAGTNTMLASGLLLLGGLALKRRRNLDARRTRTGKSPSITLA